MTRPSAPLLNLRESDGRLLREEEWRLGQLSELAVFLADGGKAETARELLSLAADAVREEGVPLTHPSDRAALARFLLREAERRFGRLSVGALLGSECGLPARGRTVLLDSPPSEEALARFLPFLSSPAPQRRNDLRALCDDVANGYADYAVLPLFVGGAPIGSSFAMLEEWGLAVLLTACVSTEGEEQELGLIARDPAVLLAPTHLAVSYLVDTPEEASLSLAEASALSLRTVYAETVPMSPGEDARVCRGVFTGEDTLAFIAYLLLFAKDFSVLGLYTELKKGASL